MPFIVVIGNNEHHYGPGRMQASNSKVIVQLDCWQSLWGCQSVREGGVLELNVINAPLHFLSWRAPDFTHVAIFFLYNACKLPSHKRWDVQRGSLTHMLPSPADFPECNDLPGAVLKTCFKCSWHLVSAHIAQLIERLRERPSTSAAESNCIQRVLIFSRRLSIHFQKLLVFALRVSGLCWSLSQLS